MVGKTAEAYWDQERGEIKYQVAERVVGSIRSSPSGTQT